MVEDFNREYRANITSRFPNNSEACASELLGNREDMSFQ